MKFSYNTYKEMAVIALEGRFGKDKIKTISITKNNGVEKEGIHILMESQCVSPVIYFDDTKRLYDESDVLEFVEEAAYAYKESYRFNEQGLKDIYDWDKVKDVLRPQIINCDANEKRLKHFPYICIMDLAVIFTIIVKDILSAGDNATITVSNFLLEVWDANEEILYQQALKNLGNAKYEIKSIREMLTESGLYENFHEKDEHEPQLFVLTCYEGIGGAATILSPKILRESCERMGCSKVYILPSSIHELLLVDAEKAEASALQAIVKEVNTSIVNRTEYLSDNVYMYDRITGKVTITETREIEKEVVA